MRLLRFPSVVSVLVACMLVTACGESDASVDLKITFTPPLVGSDVRSIELSLVENCDGLSGGRPTAAADRTWTLVQGEALPKLTGIVKGAGALYARGFENDCTVIAAGCEEFFVEPAKKTTVTLVLSAVANGPGCGSGLVCESGVCVDQPDSAVDDAGDDAGPPTEDCTGAADKTACQDGDALGQCRDEACCTGCWNGATCLPGSDATACGATGGDCAACECGDDTCDEGACVPSVPMRKVFGSLETTCAIDGEGELWCWGAGDLGQLGIGSGAVAPKNDCAATRGVVTGVDCFPSPVRVGLSPGTEKWTQLDLGTAHACGVDAANGLYCWGDDAFEQLGNGSGGAKFTPFAVAGSWRAVAAYDDHTCGVKSDSTFACWGSNGSHEYSTSMTTKFNAPLALSGFDMADSWTEVAAGNQHVCGIQVGLPWCWGGNTAGQTGVPNATSPVPDIMPVVGPPGTGVYSQLMAGSSFTCAMRAVGAAPAEGWCWGSNVYGQFGTGVMGLAAGDAATEVPWGDYDGRLAVGAFHACGIDGEGRLDCWGRSNFGQLGTGKLGADLGNGNRGEDSDPTAAHVGDASDWIGVGLGRFHSCGIREGGRLYCWGRNSAGQLGVGMTDVSIGAEASAVAVPTRVCVTP